MDKMRFESVDGVERNISKIEELFPSCIKEGIDDDGNICKGIDFDALKILLGDELLGEEKCEYVWVGKRNVIIEANKPIKKTLRPIVEESVEIYILKAIILMF